MSLRVQRTQTSRPIIQIGAQNGEINIVDPEAAALQPQHLAIQPSMSLQPSAQVPPQSTVAFTQPAPLAPSVQMVPVPSVPPAPIQPTVSLPPPTPLNQPVIAVPKPTSLEPVVTVPQPTTVIVQPPAVPQVQIHQQGQGISPVILKLKKSGKGRIGVIALVAIVILAIIVGVIIWSVMGKKEHQKSEKGCEEGWEEASGSCYLYKPQPLSWHEAQTECAHTGGNLASIHNDHESNDILSYMSVVGPPQQNVWIGGYSSTSSHYQGFAWTDGSPFDYDQFDKWSFDLSQGVEPNQGALGSCVLLMRRQPDPRDDKYDLWWDEVCDKQLPFLCQKDTRETSHAAHASHEVHAH